MNRREFLKGLSKSALLPFVTPAIEFREPITLPDWTPGQDPFATALREYICEVKKWYVDHYVLNDPQFNQP